MKHSRLLTLLLALGGAAAGSANAQSLLALYETARAYDAPYRAAKAQLEAAQARAEQALASNRPTVTLSGSANMAAIDNSLPLSQQGFYANQGATVSASRAVYRPANQFTIDQGQKQIEVAQQQLATVEQDLIVRVSSAYFDVLAAQDTLTFVLAQKAAVSEQLASAKRNFEVGTATITDTREAQARFDLVLAQELAAGNDLQVRRIALDQVVGQANTQPKPVRLPLTLPALAPDAVDSWVGQAESNHPGIRQSRLALELAQLETGKAQTGTRPTVDMVGSYNFSNNLGSTSTSRTYQTNQASVGITFAWPLYTGESVQNRVRETLALEDKARNDLDTSRRTVSQATRTAYFGLLSGHGQVKALEAAEASSQSALEANKLGYQVGVRINIDVLNSQSQLYDTKAKLAKARYDVLVGGLRLRQASGVLKAEDLQPIHALLAP